MQTLHIGLFGDFALHYGEEPIHSLNTARLQSLLAYLVLQRAAPQPRRQLAFLLWPDSAEGQARSNLRNLVHLLRHALPNADAFLQIDAVTVQWRSDAPFTLDVARFEAAIAAADQTQNSNDRVALRRTLEEAAILYQGDLLPDCYDEWIQPERERLRQLFVSVLERLVEIASQQNDLPAAIRYAQRLLRLDPLHETIYQRLIRLYLQLGDRAHAINTYHTCVTVLQRELGVKPSIATQALFRQMQKLRQQSLTHASPTEIRLSERRTHNLPALLTTFVGRADALASLKHALGKTRLLTLTWPGGCGKTRLALAVANGLLDHYPDGIWLVAFGSLHDATLLAATVANVLSLLEEPTRPILATLVDSLCDQQMLLIFDTCEHLIDDCATLAQTLLHACPKLHILATSRERLAVAGEMIWPVPPLTMPPLEALTNGELCAPAHLQQYEAVQLLVDRIQSVLPTFTLTTQNAQAIGQIALHLDGMPLALELAAARASLLSVQEIAAHLDQRFQLLHYATRDADPRHQTLAAALDWSYDRLSPAEQRLLRRLAIFDSTFTLTAVQSICTDLPETTPGTALSPDFISPDSVFALLAHLVDKSLVNAIPQPTGTTRYGLLESIRAYGDERLLAANEVTACRQRHLHFFTQLAEAAEPHLRWSDQVDWLDQLEAEQENTRAALNWSLNAPASPEKFALGLSLGGALWRFWRYRGHYREGSSHLIKLLSATSPTHTTSAAYAKVLLGAGCLVGEQGDYAAAQQFLERALAHYQALKLTAGIAEATYSLAWLANWRSDPVTARNYYEVSIALYQQLDDSTGLAWALRGLAWLDRIAGDLGQSEARIQESLRRFQQAGDLAGLSFAMGGLAYLALDRADYITAQQSAEQSLVYARQVGDRHAISMCLRLLGRLAQKTNRYQQASDFFNESLTICRTLNDRYGIAQNYHSLGEAALSLGDLAQATHDLRIAGDFYRAIDDKPGIAWLLLTLGDLAHQAGDDRRAAQEYSEGLQLAQAIQQPWLITASQQRLDSLTPPSANPST